MLDDPVASYVFRLRFRLDPRSPDAHVSPSTFDTVLRIDAATPGESGWLFFRDNLWRGEVNEETHLRELATDALGVPVEAISFSELRATPSYVDALEDAIAEDLEPFEADSVDEVLHKYLGSSIRVEE
jgi:hypothetical protein